MNQLEVFYDYFCPYCMRGHGYLTELMPSYPNIQVVWRPCEAHPRPEEHGMHSDLCLRGMYICQDLGGDLMAYHSAMFKACFEDRIDIEDPAALARSVAGIVDEAAFCQALLDGKHADKPDAANRLAFQESGVWAVPSYRMNGKKLDAVEGVGVTKEQLAAFMDGADK